MASEDQVEPPSSLHLPLLPPVHASSRLPWVSDMHVVSVSTVLPRLDGVLKCSVEAPLSTCPTPPWPLVSAKCSRV